MRIAYVVNQYPAVSHSFIRREIQALEQLGVEVDRFSIRAAQLGLVDSGDIAEMAKTVSILSSGVGVILWSILSTAVRQPLPFLSTLLFALKSAGFSPERLLRHFAYLAEACFLRKRVATNKVDHVHAHFGTNPATVVRMLRRLGGPTFSVTMHGPDEFNAAHFYDLEGKINEAAATMAISDYGRGQLMMWSDVTNWDKLHVVRCGLDDVLLSHRSIPIPATSTFCTVARLSEQKGIPLLIEAAAILRAEGHDFEINIVGEGPLRPILEQRIKVLGLTEKVVLKGALSSDNVRAELLQSRAMILPSFAEGLPVVIMEALALERPVITTRITGIPELVDQECGWIISAGRADQLASAMKEAMTATPEELQTMGAVGRARVREQHDIAKSAKQLFGIFEHCIAADRK
jgi:colanic acid/amylovoran biosynthesis glycosyltransferase